MNRLQPKRINLIQALRAKEPADRSVLRKRILTAVPCCLAAGCLLAFGVLQGLRLMDEAKMNSCVIAVGDMANNARYQQALDTMEEIESLQGDISRAKELRGALDSYPALNRDFFAAVNGCVSGGIQLSGIDYSAADTLLLLRGSCPSAEEISAFVQRLRETELFSEITYSGYSKQENAYQFEITGTPKGREAEKDVQ